MDTSFNILQGTCNDNVAAGKRNIKSPFTVLVANVILYSEHQ